MTYYYYNKYNTNTTYTYKTDGSRSDLKLTLPFLKKPLSSTVDYFVSYAWSSTQGYYGTGFVITRKAGEPPATTYYAFADGNAYYVQYSTFTSGGNTYHTANSQNSTRTATYTRGSLVQSNIVGTNYPVNGRHSDGYWYVRGAVVLPSTPSSITIPSTIKGGTSINISWNNSSYATSYYLERSVNGGAYSQIYVGSITNYLDTIIKGWNTVSYRVRAYNSGGYSSYKNSSIVTIKNFPELKTRVSSTLKTSDDGWVRIDGVLRKIDGIWLKANGALKEL